MPDADAIISFFALIIACLTIWYTIESKKDKDKAADQKKSEAKKKPDDLESMLDAEDSRQAQPKKSKSHTGKIFSEPSKSHDKADSDSNLNNGNSGYSTDSSSPRSAGVSEDDVVELMSELEFNKTPKDKVDYS